MAPKVREARRRAARLLRIKLSEPQRVPVESRKGGTTPSFTTLDDEDYAEATVHQWLRELRPTTKQLVQYVRDIFPFTEWVPLYNTRWLLGDVVAGITVGAILVPQSMAYASLAALPPQFGLYSSFMGLIVYWLFATSKDITIGPVAVMSTIAGNIVLRVKKSDPDLPGHVVASALAVLCGAIITFIGLARLGWIVDFISLAAISAFMTGSAISIAVGQVPSLMGITGFSSREATYKVVINVFRHLGRANINAAMGLTALLLLYLIRLVCHLVGRRWPRRRRLFDFLATLRVAFVILLYVMISWLVNRHHRKKPRLAILGVVPRGFQNAGAPQMNLRIVRTFASQLPAAVIVLVIEHISIAKSFARVNHYSVDPSQEMVATGMTNLLGPFLGAYPVTGSFSRTAINSKAGVRTPAGSLVSCVVVLLAIYALPAVFFYIPNAALSAVIIHAVLDLVTTPNTVYRFWKVSPFEVLIFLAGVLVTVFSSIENGVYTTVCVSLAMLLFRFAKARGSFLGKVKVHTVVGDRLLPEHGTIERGSGVPSENQPELAARNVFLPMDHTDGTNPDVAVESPYPGVYIYRFSEGFNYPNAGRYLDHFTRVIRRSTRPTDDTPPAHPGDLSWNEASERRRHGKLPGDLPTLQAIILDFSSVNHVDITAMQNLIDVRNDLDRWAAPDMLEWHVACITNRWTRRALVHAGFGYPTSDSPQYHVWKPVFSVAEIGGKNSAATTAQMRDNVELLQQQQRHAGSRVGSARASSVGGARPGRPQQHVRLASDDYHAQIARAARPASSRMSQMSEVTRAKLENGSGGGGAVGDDSTTSGDDLEMQVRKAVVPGRKKSSKVALVNGINRPLFHIVDGVNRPLFHVTLASALQSAIHNIEMKRQLRPEHISEESDVTERATSSAADNPTAPERVFAPV